MISRTSVQRYAENWPSIPEIGRELGVGAVMEGSVRFADARIRVAIQLIDARTDQHIWAETYDSDFSNVFEVQADIASNVAQAMSLEFSLAERQDLLELPTGSSEAYALYLRAWNTGAMAPLNVRDDALLDPAIALDPNFALAHALKSLTQARRLINLLGVEAVAPANREEAEATIRRHATRAIEIDPNVPYVHVALGNLYQNQWYWTATTTVCGGLRSHSGNLKAGDRARQRFLEHRRGDSALGPRRAQSSLTLEAEPQQHRRARFSR